ncbi:hypothetical protein P175DRAFT_0526544 [Aspergillus ochraceoroseus IBT 24754]|uniref:rRNA adenine N(6)-methyltransferase n=2 Tax=Aspergillus ochraceoroseus TaxID=138278 RepID=A0A2T5LMJ4_9EURO|nr:uncharacterized protein P175DRAFT_0526544 [Aspergillus ochraceoroseus IBT 24754]KKK12085.1 hypothetical protein AOCH_000038 [Aspergillus ochraceoroseus]PTU17508.1 hypothetical protein P175DRAFT_0526544 [Aspergillus ochraceoroseus IBT 24754]
MPKTNRWSTLAQFPITKTLYKCLPRARNAKLANKPNIVSDKLCDDVLQRLSPFLLRNRPVDILDLWPGAGLFSSKVNDFLQPRRHVLIEPDLSFFKPLLEPLAESRPCYKLLSTDISSIHDWQTVLSEHFPEQGPGNSDSSGGVLPKNDTLLVLAHPPPTSSSKDHFTGARWWSVFMEACMRQVGLHSYGSVRLLASMPMSDSQAILARTIGERRRPALLTEQVALHAFEVAAPKDQMVGLWAFWKQWDMVVNGAARVAERTAEHGVTIPPGREYPPIERAPESPQPGRKPTPYAPRAKTPQNDGYVAAFEAADQMNSDSPDYAKAKSKRSRACTQLNQENRQVYIRNILADKQAEIDELNKSISRLAADPETKAATVDTIVKQIETVQAEFNNELSQHHFDITRSLPGLTDDKRAAFHSGTFDNALLLWDRRPFEPLLIHPEELYPRDIDRTLIYFEADSNAPAMERLSRLDPSQRDLAFRLFEAFSLTLSSQSTLTVAKLIELIFPTRSINDILKSVPSLAQYASKRPRPDFDSLSKPLHSNADGSPSPSPSSSSSSSPSPSPSSSSSSSPPPQQGQPHTPNPILSYQENLEYDLSGVHIRTLSPATLWDLCLEYQRRGSDQSAIQLNRLLGGTLTSSRSREFLDGSKKRLH